jgi:excinuclease ABC subunit B
MSQFKLHSKFDPAGDQPKAISELVAGLDAGKKEQVLLGVTGSGKTFTMANVIAQHGKPTLILSHNKSLAAQLYEEFKTFFPENKVCFFISYYDYYQPESYLPSSDTYIEKESDINHKIEEYRMEAISALSTRDDVIVISSVSCIYALGNPDNFREHSIGLEVGQSLSRTEFISQLIALQYERNDVDLKSGRFRVRGEVIDIIQGYGKELIRIEFFGDEIERMAVLDPVNLNELEVIKDIVIFPASPFTFGAPTIENATKMIAEDLKVRLKELPVLERHRLKQRTLYDLEMMGKLGYCKGMENYSRYFDGRMPGEPAYSLLDFFPDDFLFFIDESHVTLPQVQGMYKGDRARKVNLIEHGFRLPSAADNRPLKFEEFEKYLNKVVYVSATPADYELNHSGEDVVEQIIRPTGLVDPPIELHKTEGQIAHLIEEMKPVIDKDGRILVTTLTKRMAEELNNYLLEQNIRSTYLHSDIGTMERIEILRDLRLGRFDVLIGVNLLREGLDLPEVALVAILDADRAGFLRTARSLIQTIGRAARNADSKVLMYADTMSPAMQVAIDETMRRRKLQLAYNDKHGIVPKTILKDISEATDIDSGKKGKRKKQYSRHDEIVRLETEMEQAANRLDFEKAIELREQVKSLKAELGVE